MRLTFLKIENCLFNARIFEYLSPSTINIAPVKQREVVTSCSYGLLDLNKLWSCQYGRKNENIDMYDFPKHNCTQEQKLYHSKVTPHFSLLPLVGYRHEYKIAVRMQLK